ncbi:MAG: CAP domain-containing protein [Candidatus Paceibacteria bacterium]
MRRILRKLNSFFLPLAENNFFPYSLRPQAILIYIIVAVLIKLLSLSGVATLPKTDFFAQISSKAIISSTNIQRLANGIPTLNENPVLTQAAYQKAQDMLAKKYFAHTSPDGKTPWYWFLKNGYEFSYAGENLAIDFFESEDVVRAWMESNTHRANILNENYKDIGVAVVAGDIEGRETTLVVQLFASPKALPRQIAFLPTPSPEALPEVLKESASSQKTISAATSEPGVVAGFEEVKPKAQEPIEFAQKFLESRPELANEIFAFVGDPRWLYLAFIVYIAIAFILGIASVGYEARPQAVIGAFLAIAVIVTLFYLPDSKTMLGLQAKVIP